jgi:ATP-dependent Clp protease ATP-binding subunit ClpA
VLSMQSVAASGNDGGVSRDAFDPAELRGLDDAAMRAIAAAAREARELGHDHVGTEHVLLGLLTAGSETSTTLTDAGITVAAARAKVIEAVGTSTERQVGVSESLRRTARAARALVRAARFAHVDGSDAITSDHVLRGVLDVEGTAGQVLRGLGVEVDSLRGSLETEGTKGATEPPRDHAARTISVPRCPSCEEALEEHLVCRVIAATTESGARRDAVVFSCGVCGWVLGVSAA